MTNILVDETAFMKALRDSEIRLYTDEQRKETDKKIEEVLSNKKLN